MKVRIRYLHETIAYYPDAMVVCDPTDDDPYFRDRPTVLFEVASETTERLDKREKLFAYVTIPTLEEYVIVEQSRMAALVFRRAANWVSETVGGPEGVIALQSLQCELPFSDLYARVDFRPPESASR
jgi:Uma2 family endonuclease